MKRVEISAYGAPEEVVACIDAPEVGTPGPGEVVFDVLAFPINPADMSFCRGAYRLRPPLPATPGAECVGRVTAVGAGVTDLAPGDLVINLDRENWAQRRRVAANRAVRLPAALDTPELILQAAMIRINPPTALLLMSEFVDLRPGDWMIQNVANSSVGRMIVRLAKERGVNVLCVTRRADVFAELTALGAAACVLDGPDLSADAAKLTGGAPVRLGLDAVAGEASGRMAGCLAEDGVLVVYGSMSKEPATIPSLAFVARGLAVRGFMLGRFLDIRPPEAVRAVYARTAQEVIDGVIRAPIDSLYPIEDIRDAVAHALAAGRNGKILVTPQRDRV